MFGGGFGGGMGGYGGQRNPVMRYARLGLFAAVILAGVAFNHSGRTYDVIRGVYFVAIIGLLLYSMSVRRSRARNLPGGWGGAGGLPGGRRQGQGQGGMWPGPVNAPGQTVDVRTVPNNPTANFGQQPGWFPDPSDTTLERYWDGTNWAQSRPRETAGPTGS